MSTRHPITNRGTPRSDHFRMSDNSATKPLQEIQGRVSPKSSPAPRRLSDSSSEVTAKALDFGAVTARLHIAPASHPVAAVIDKQPRTPFSRALPHACQRLLREKVPGRTGHPLLTPPP